MFRRSAALVLAVVALVCSSCEASVSTSVKVLSSDTAAISVVVQLKGSAAETFASDPDMAAQLVELFERHAGREPELEASSELVTASAAVDLARLVDASALTGVSSLALRTSADGATLSADVVRPERLVSALTESVEGEPDADALGPALLAGVTVTLVVEFPGAVSSVDAPMEYVEEGSSVTITQDLLDYTEGRVEVTGSLSAGPPWAMIAAAAALLVAAGAMLRRRPRA